MTAGPRLAALEARVAALGHAVVAFSGGVDSSVVAAIAHRALGDRARAVTAVSPSVATGELEGAQRVARHIGIAHEIVRTDELARPGLKAAAEHDVVHPLFETTKDEVRALARALQLPSADKPASPCLASRIPYGTGVDPETLAQIDRAEQAVKRLGFPVIRVRHHGILGRLEVAIEDLDRALSAEPGIVQAIKDAGYQHATIDLKPFKSGRLNVEPARPATSP